MKRILICILLSLTALSLSAQEKMPFYDKGYAGNVELGGLVKSYPYGTRSTTHGYCFGKGWFIGLGAAFETGLYPRMMEKKPDGPPVYAYDPDIPPREGFSTTKYPYEGDMMVKMFLDLRKTFLLDQVLLFADVKYGSPFNLAEPFGFGDFVRPSIGIVLRSRLGLSTGVDWSSYPYPDAGTDVVHPKQITLPYIGIAYQF